VPSWSAYHASVLSLRARPPRAGLDEDRLVNILHLHTRTRIRSHTRLRVQLGYELWLTPVIHALQVEVVGIPYHGSSRQASLCAPGDIWRVEPSRKEAPVRGQRKVWLVAPLASPPAPVRPPARPPSLPLSLNMKVPPSRACSTHGASLLQKQYGKQRRIERTAAR